MKKKVWIAVSAGVSALLLVLVVCLLLWRGRQVVMDPEEIVLNRDSIELSIGETFQLEWKVRPKEANQTVTFESEEPKIAEVSEKGLITAVAEGSARITVQAGSKTAACEVAVKAAKQDVLESECVNGFYSFTPGGLLGAEGGTYMPVSMTAVGERAVTFSGKGGLSWPDTANMPIPSAMGGYYGEELALDGLAFTYQLDQPMNFAGDHWYVIALGDQCQLFNSWNGEDPVKTLFFMLGFEDGKMYLMPHYRDVIELGESWSYLGRSGGVSYQDGDTVTIQFRKTEAGYCVYLNGQLQTFDNIRSPYISIIPELFPEEKVWLMAAAHIGNPGEQYEGEYAFTLGLAEASAILLEQETAGSGSEASGIGTSNNVSGFLPFSLGGLVGQTTYHSGITVTAVGSGDRVKVEGYGGTNYGDTSNPRSTMGVYSTKKYGIDGLEILYSVEDWVQSGDHWYAIALTEKNGTWFENDGSDKALFFMFAYDNGRVVLKAHHIGNGAGWTHLGDSQGVTAVGGQYSICFKRNGNGYQVYMKNAEQNSYTLQTFGRTSTISASIVDGLFPGGKAYLMAGGYVASYEGKWSFVLGAHEDAGIVSDNPKENPTNPEDPKKPEEPIDPVEPIKPIIVNGFTAFAQGGLVGGMNYDPDIILNDCGGMDRVQVTGRGGTNYGDAKNPRSTMGVYSLKAYEVDGLEILYSVEQWIGSGNHWYAIALTEKNETWFENDGSDKALFFLFEYSNGNVILKAHHIGNGAGWTYLGTSQGVPAAGGQYSIYLHKTEDGYRVYMKNAEQTDYTLQSFDGETSVSASIVDGLFADGKAYLMSGGYVESYDEKWSFVLGAHEKAEVKLPTEPEPMKPIIVNGFTAFAQGGLVGGMNYDPDIILNDCGGMDRVQVTGRGGTNYGDAKNPRSTMGVYSLKAYEVDGLEILYSVEQWIGSGNHWYAIALTEKNETWFENDGSDKALFFLFEYSNGNVILKAHHIGNGAGWTYLGTSQGVPAAGGQYSIYLHKTEDGYRVYMKNAEQTDYTLQSFDGETSVSASIVDGLFADGKAYLMSGGYVESYDGQWSFVLGVHEKESFSILADPAKPEEPYYLGKDTETAR